MRSNRRSWLSMSIASALASLYKRPITSLSNHERYSMPVNKESFKQARRKQLKVRAKKRAKKLGHA